VVPQKMFRNTYISVCKYIYVYVYVIICMYIHTYIYMHICTYRYAYIHTYIHTYIFMDVCDFTEEVQKGCLAVRDQLYRKMCGNIHVHICVNICMYTYNGSV